MARITVFVALALQLFACVAPTNAFVICLSSDGCIELEPAAPGAGRCAEDVCDDGHAGDAAHSCRDIPVLVDAGTPSRAVAFDHGPLLTALAVAPRLDLPAVAAPPRTRAAARHTPPLPRTVVLQL